MSLWEGDWSSEIRFEGKAHQDDGTLHICPFSDSDTSISGQQSVSVAGVAKTHALEEGSVTAGENDDKFRFDIEYKRDGQGGKYYYKGNAKVLNDGKGPSFIYGMVTLTPEIGAASSGVWGARKISGPGTGPGGGEPGNQGSSMGTPPGGGETGVLRVKLVT